MAALLAARRIERVPVDRPSALLRLMRAEEKLEAARQIAAIDVEVAYLTANDATRIAVTAHMLANGYRARAIARAHEAVGDYAEAMIASPSSREFQRMRRRRNIRPSTTTLPLVAPTSFVARSITSEALERASPAGWSVVTDDGTGRLRLGERTVRLDSTIPAQLPPRPRGRPGRSVFSVVRALFALEYGARQDEIAEFAHVGQAAVSKSLNRLAERDLVARGERGWEVTDRAGAVSWWLAHYPGPGGIETHWFGVDPINEQAYRAYEALYSGRANPVVSATSLPTS